VVEQAERRLRDLAQAGRITWIVEPDQPARGIGAEPLQVGRELCTIDALQGVDLAGGQSCGTPWPRSGGERRGDVAEGVDELCRGGGTDARRADQAQPGLELLRACGGGTRVRLPVARWKSRSSAGRRPGGRPRPACAPR
jgi:hypothetical protein